MAEEPAPAVAVASGGDAPSVDEQAAGQAAAAAGASAVLAGQAEADAAEADAAAQLAAQAATVAAQAVPAAEVAADAAAATAADRSQLEQFMQSQTALNSALVARIEQLSAPVPEPAEPAKPDRAPGPKKEHWINRRIGGKSS